MWVAFFICFRGVGAFSVPRLVAVVPAVVIAVAVAVVVVVVFVVVVAVAAALATVIAGRDMMRGSARLRN